MVLRMGWDGMGGATASLEAAPVDAGYPKGQGLAGEEDKEADGCDAMQCLCTDRVLLST